ncbi:autophagy-related protein 27 [Schizophyllum amplum]|uniref:Autophagy-related protein 27 n=1 Tax=Schizophyllum amplum TaxID=97359 RepID=A0A550CYU6_9AGAR|nr:autophagy-related protein 27 [Auriculariopsis ampla]
MYARRRITLKLSQLLAFAAVLLLAPCALADDNAFECHFTLEGTQYDLTLLGGEHSIARTRDLPPSTMVDTLRFDVCAELPRQEGVDDRDQCPAGTRACLSTINQKADHDDRVVSVIPVAQGSFLDASYSLLSSPEGISLTLHGASYPHPTNSTPTPQALVMTLLCSGEAMDPKFTSYDGAELQVEWAHPAACKNDVGDGGDTGGDKTPADDGEPKSMGSGIGFFFLVLILALVGYFVLGAYYNYSTYGATGKDLIPHRDFWREVPNMLSDVVSHLCSSVRPRHNTRGGYIAV